MLPEHLDPKGRCDSKKKPEDVFPKGNIMFFCITYLLMNVFLWQC
ncbi:hypothetical protein ZOSMA_173G00020 [Zostera marina]|uniref:Uncharacterized protein n=1 Tax=Zostera marina TaxID=29655 RepID=A0A0K9PUB6_ZOSMR|nr:hypothetical protein ZOSMA_173G00020 [Zostera marina]